MRNRIKDLRKSLGLNQTEFGEKLCIAQTTVAGYENGSRVPSDAIIKSICQEYGVNETWLRTGYGDMFRPRSYSAELGELIRSRLIEAPDSFQVALLRLLLRLEPNGPEMKMLREFCETLAEETKKDPEP